MEKGLRRHKGEGEGWGEREGENGGKEGWGVFKRDVEREVGGELF